MNEDCWLLSFCQFTKGFCIVLARNSKLRPFCPNWEDLDLTERRFENLPFMKKINLSKVPLRKISATFHIWGVEFAGSMHTHQLPCVSPCISANFWDWDEVVLWCILDQTVVTLKNKNSLYHITEKYFTPLALLALKILFLTCQKFIASRSVMAKDFW